MRVLVWVTGGLGGRGCYATDRVWGFIGSKGSLLRVWLSGERWAVGGCERRWLSGRRTVEPQEIGGSVGIGGRTWGLEGVRRRK